MGKSFNVHVKLEGIPDACMRLKGARLVAGRAMARSLYKEAETIMAQSKQLVPVKTGVLRSSGHVQPPKPARNHNYIIDMGYGGPAVPYAVVQHEALHFKHTHGEAKYLEKPTLQRSKGMSARVGKDVRAALFTLARKQGR